MASSIVIKQPVWFRAFLIVVGLVDAGVVVGLAIASDAHPPLVPLLMGAATCALGYRLYVSAVIGGDDELIVRNRLRTQHLPRAAIEDFRPGALSGKAFGKTIHVLLRDGSVLSLDVLDGMYGTSRGKQRLQRRLESLRGWLAAPS